VAGVKLLKLDDKKHRYTTNHTEHTSIMYGFFIFYWSSFHFPANVFTAMQDGHSAYSAAYSALQTGQILFFLTQQGLQKPGLIQSFFNSMTQ
jgi:hypothetical protein